MSATKPPFDTACDIDPASWGSIAGLRMGKMKCVNSATRGPMKMNQQRDEARSTHDDGRQPDAPVAGCHGHRCEQHGRNHARDLSSFRRFHRVLSCWSPPVDDDRMSTAVGQYVFPVAEGGAVVRKRRRLRSRDGDGVLRQQGEALLAANMLRCEAAKIAA